MKNKTLIFVILLLSAGVFKAQSQATAKFKFDNTEHNFGKIMEDKGIVDHKFLVKNTGTTPLIITKVEASCGCTTPEWTRSPIGPGQTGFVSAAFNPINRPNAFNKTVKVWTNTQRDPVTLFIRGDVIPKTKSVEDLYRYNMGPVRLKSNHIAFANVMNDKKKAQKLEVINTSNENVTVEFKNVPKHITISVSPKQLKAGEIGTITATFNPELINDWGYNISRIYLKINDKSDSQYRISVSATIKENFSKLTKTELDNAPTMDFEELEHQFGTIKQGDVIVHVFKFKNNGKRDLLIRKTSAACGCTAVEVKKVIKAGETGTIKVTFNSTGKKGNQNKSVTIITNIPGKDSKKRDKNRTILRMKGIVN